MRPIVAITMGDAAGIGPEIIVKTLAKQGIYRISRPFVIGDAKVMKRALKFSPARLKLNIAHNFDELRFEFGSVDVYDLDNIDVKRLRIGKVSKPIGRAAIEYIFKAVELAKGGHIHATVSAPVNKEAMHKAGYDYAGQTELLAELTKAKSIATMVVLGKLWLASVTTHVSLKRAIQSITKERILPVIKLAHETLKEIRGKEPKLAVAGLNPHAGEGGIFGREEIEEIIPAIKLVNKQGISVEGPIPADTVFVRAKNGEFDAVITMYHDQQNIPIKLLGFGRGATVTVGLPLVRTTTLHGTAFDIAGKGIADHRSFEKALRIAAMMARAKLT